MADVTEISALTSGFQQARREDWLAVVEKTLKGADFRKRLVSRTMDGLPIEPIYDRGATSAAAVQRPHGPWSVTARLDYPHLATANALALDELEGGADGLALVMQGSPAARGFGLALASADDMEACLAGVMLEYIHLHLEPHPRADLTGHWIETVATRQGLDAGKLTVSFGLDPLRHESARTWTSIGADLARFVDGMRTSGFRGPFITCDARPVSEAGGSEAQEIAFALASGVAYARALTANGMPVSEAYQALSWTVAIDADQFLGIAKLRVLRGAWARVLDASGVPAQAMPVHAETAWRMMTRHDPAVNMLRSTMATFVAAVGGADSIAVLPHTLPIGLPDRLSRRIARNTQLVLQEESQLWRVTDPAAGAGAFEALTAELAEAAWALFQEIEREGGLVESLQSGALQSRIAGVAKSRVEAIVTRKAPITGTSEFPTLSEAKGGVFAEVEPTHPAAQNRMLDLPSQRLAEPFEALRAAADGAAARVGSTPSVFLANLGSPAEYGARSMWIGNLLAAGGIASVAQGGFSASAPAGAALAASGATVAVVCSDDNTYAELGEAAVACLKAAGAVHIAVAGKPGPLEAALRAAGVDQFIFAGQDVVAALHELHHALGIE